MTKKQGIRKISPSEILSIIIFFQLIYIYKYKMQVVESLFISLSGYVDAVILLVFDYLTYFLLSR
jgi:hypothetical protein